MHDWYIRVSITDKSRRNSAPMEHQAGPTPPTHPSSKFLQCLRERTTGGILMPPAKALQEFSPSTFATPLRQCLQPQITSPRVRGSVKKLTGEWILEYSEYSFYPMQDDKMEDAHTSKLTAHLLHSSLVPRPSQLYQSMWEKVRRPGQFYDIMTITTRFRTWVWTSWQLAPTCPCYMTYT